MQARLAVKKGVTGVGMAYDPKAKNLIACYDVQKAKSNKAEGMDEVTAAKRAYRMIDANSITHLNLGGTKYLVLGDGR